MGTPSETLSNYRQFKEAAASSTQRLTINSQFDSFGNSKPKAPHASKNAL